MTQRQWITKVVKEGNDTIVLFPDELMVQMKLQEGDALVWDHFNPGEEEEYFTLHIFRKETIENLKNRKEAP